MYKTTDSGTTFINLNEGFLTTQFYPGFANAADDSTIALGGLQDNGTLKYVGGPSWIPVWGGDGGWCAIDPTNKSTVYAETQYGRIVRSYLGRQLILAGDHRAAGQPVGLEFHPPVRDLAVGTPGPLRREQERVQDDQPGQLVVRARTGPRRSTAPPSPASASRGRAPIRCWRGQARGRSAAVRSSRSSRSSNGGAGLDERDRAPAQPVSDGHRIRPVRQPDGVPDLLRVRDAARLQDDEPRRIVDQHQREPPRPAAPVHRRRPGLSELPLRRDGPRDLPEQRRRRELECATPRECPTRWSSTSPCPGATTRCAPRRSGTASTSAGSRGFRRSP